MLRNLPLELIDKDIARKDVGYFEDFFREQIEIEKTRALKDGREWNAIDVGRLKVFKDLLDKILEMAKQTGKSQKLPDSEEIYKGSNPATMQVEMRKKSIWIRPDGMIEYEDRKIPMEVRFHKI